MKAIARAMLLGSFVGCGSTGMNEPVPIPPSDQTTETTSARTSSGLDPRRIQNRVDGHVPELSAMCGELQSSDRYATTLHLEIAPSGGVDVADARGSVTRLDKCIAEVARSWSFDPTNVRSIADVPVVLEKH